MSSMPGAYQTHEADEVDLPVTEDEAYSPSAEDLELTIGNALETASSSDDDDDDEEEDEDYIDGDFGEDYNAVSDGDLDMDEDFDEDGNYIGDDPELAEAERLASMATDEEGEHEEAREDSVRPSSGYTLAIDPTTSRVYLVDNEGNHQELNTGSDDNANRDTARGHSDTLSILSRLLGRRSLRTPRPTNNDDEDDDEDGLGMFQYGFRGGRRTAEGLFPPASAPVPAGVELERQGLFGRPGLRYDAFPKKRFGSASVNLNDSLRVREYRQPCRTMQRFDFGDASIPNSAGTEVAKYDANIYCGQYSQDGSFFYTCAQDYKIRIYDMLTPNTDKSVNDSLEEQAGRRYRSYRMYNDYDKSSLALSKTIQAREHLSSWTITDANLSPDNTKMIWSTIGPVVGMTRVRESPGDMDSYDDGDGQVALDFGSGRTGSRRHFGIWSVRFSADGREIVAGAGSGSIYVYDLESRQTVLSIFAHKDDVNAVCFADTASSNVLVSGSDDNYLKVWDRRSLGETGRHTKPSGVLVGHTEGITYVDPKGDGRFVLSNGKDQTCKLWDLRMMYSDEQFTKLDRLDVSVHNYDYRHGLYRKPRFEKHPHDRSLLTYTGHTVLRTLIRCHFSPASTTGQHYVYSGSYDGRIHIWNLDGTVKQILDRRHTMPLLTKRSNTNAIRMNDPSQPDRPPGTYPTASSSPVVRDVSWAPYAPNIMSSAWTESGGSLAMHEWKGYGKRQDPI